MEFGGHIECMSEVGEIFIIPCFDLKGKRGVRRVKFGWKTVSERVSDDSSVF
jgi:hypothetical protein